ncbi:hypothetical protein LJR225_004107 [Phenylobacterium sp. LjRoot225]|uniref:sulfotransferase family protein n=1 Tax=Phenylobacterium sp. LjRoot225 TaxID=3342285 RepID=UPI003ECCEDFF
MSTTRTPAPPKPTAEPRRTAYLVLGMHRSGTSAMTQLLSLAGAQLPKNLMPGDEHNAQGYFEPWRIAMFNDERLRAAGSAWDDVFAYPCPAVPDAEAAAWRERASALFAEEYAGRRHPLMKDPRVTVLLPFWREVFDGAGLDARCVIPVRHPMAVANSLGRRDGFAPQKSVLLWSAYMLAAEAYSRDLPRAFVGYDPLLGDWRAQVARIERDHGAPLPKLGKRAEREIDAALTSDLRHNAATGDLAALGWTGAIASAVYDWFAAAARDEAPDRSALEAAARDLAERQREMGALVSPTARDFDATRGQLISARQNLAWDRRELEALKARFESLQRDWLSRKSVMEETERTLDALLKG